jgi:hypothetical protein
MEKSLCLVAVVALACVDLPIASAQLQLTGAHSPIQLVMQTSDGPQSEVSHTSEIANPFDFFGEIDNLTSSPSAASALPFDAPDNRPGWQPPAASGIESPSDRDPAALSIGKQQRSIVDTIVDQSMVAGIPDASYMPVQWTGAVQAPNAIATLLLREECHANALWAGYPAQRAAECNRMWQHLSHSHRGQSGCAQGGCHVGHTPIRNRYRPDASVAGCSGGACATTSLAAPQSARAGHAGHAANAAPQAPHHTAPSPGTPTPAPAITPTALEAATATPGNDGKVAFLPMFHR